MVSLLIVESSDMYRSGLMSFLNHQLATQIVGAPVTLQELFHILRRGHPVEMALGDFNLGTVPGLEVVRRIREFDPHILIMVLTSKKTSPLCLAKCFTGGIGAIMRKSASTQQILTSMNAIRSGNIVIGAQLVRDNLEYLLKRFPSTLQTHNTRDVLHERQFQVLELIAQGLSNKEIASRLGISERTVHSHVAIIFKRMGVASRAEAISKVLRSGSIFIDDATEESFLVRPRTGLSNLSERFFQ